MTRRPSLYLDYAGRRIGVATLTFEAAALDVGHEIAASFLDTTSRRGFRDRQNSYNHRPDIGEYAICRLHGTPI